MKTEQKQEALRQLKQINALKEANTWMWYLLGKSGEATVNKVEEQVREAINKNKTLIENSVKVWEEQGFAVGITNHKYFLDYRNEYGCVTNLEEEALLEEAGA